MPGDYDYHGTPPVRSGSRRLVIAMLLLLFVALLGGAGWVLLHSADAPDATADAGNDAVPVQASPAPLADPATQSTPAAGATPAATSSPAAPVTPEGLQGRMAELEQRITRVSVAAQAASSYANRAEAIMVAFATRRALDAGSPLGYIEGQLRILFGDAQPKAVATIINAAADPVTTNKLRAGIEDINLLMKEGAPNEGWWSAMKRRLSGLVEIRHAGAPSAEPEARLARARRAVEAGQIEDAIKEMAALPSQPAISQWLEQARRYNEARRALDVIEAAAILEPRTTPLLPPPMPAPTPAPAEAAPKG